MIGMTVNQFLDILKKASVGKSASSLLIENVGFSFENDGIKTSMMSDAETLIVYYKISKSAFDLYKPDEEEIAFNVPDIMRIVNEAFTGRINIKVDKDTGKLIIEDLEKRSADIDLLDPGIIKRVDEDQLEITDKYVTLKDTTVIFHGRVPQEKFKPAIKLLTKKSEDEAIKMRFKGNIIYFDYKRGLATMHDKVVAEVDISDEEVSGSYPAYILKAVLSVLSGDVSITVTEQGYMTISKVTGNESLHYLFAPAEEE